MKEARALAKKAKKPVGVMYSTLLIKYHAKKEINLLSLFHYSLWPEYLQHYGKYIPYHTYNHNTV